jgi:excisionase family DNA binding protein
MSQKLISIGKAADILGVHVDTLREWDSEGKLCPVKTIGNHRRYKIEDIESLCGNQPKKVKSEFVRVATSSKEIHDSSELCTIISNDNTIILCMSVETLRNWKDKSVLELIQSLNGDSAKVILNEE